MSDVNVINERRADVKTYLKDGSYRLDAKTKKALAEKHGCSQSAILSDLVYINNGASLVVASTMKKNILERDNYTCQYCNAKPENLVVDHVLPQVLGGVARPFNLVACCRNCNIKRAYTKQLPNNLDVLKTLNEDWYNRLICYHNDEAYPIMSDLDAILNKYGHISVLFSNYYKFTFYYTREDEDIEISASIGGDGDAIYRLVVDAMDFPLLKDLPISSVTVKEYGFIEAQYQS